MNEMPAWIQNLKKGDRILSVDGEAADVDGVGEDVHTGPNAVGTISFVDDNDDVGFGVDFECGVSIFINRQELADGNYHAVAAGE